MQEEVSKRTRRQKGCQVEEEKKSEEKEAGGGEEKCPVIARKRTQRVNTVLTREKEKEGRAERVRDSVSV